MPIEAMSPMTITVDWDVKHQFKQTKHTYKPFWFTGEGLLTDHLITGEPPKPEPGRGKRFSQTILVYKPCWFAWVVFMEHI